jgi:hypothetical protein
LLAILGEHPKHVGGDCGQCHGILGAMLKYSCQPYPIGMPTNIPEHCHSHLFFVSEDFFERSRPCEPWKALVATYFSKPNDLGTSHTIWPFSMTPSKALSSGQWHSQEQKLLLDKDPNGLFQRLRGLARDGPGPHSSLMAAI